MNFRLFFYKFFAEREVSLAEGEAACTNSAERKQARQKVKLRRGGRQPPLRNRQPQNCCSTLL